jgi:hypothetical protein
MTGSSRNWIKPSSLSDLDRRNTVEGSLPAQRRVGGDGGRGGDGIPRYGNCGR